MGAVALSALAAPAELPAKLRERPAVVLHMEQDAMWQTRNDRIVAGIEEGMPKGDVWRAYYASRIQETERIVSSAVSGYSSGDALRRALRRATGFGQDAEFIARHAQDIDARKTLLSLRTARVNAALRAIEASLQPEASSLVLDILSENIPNDLSVVAAVRHSGFLFGITPGMRPTLVHTMESFSGVMTFGYQDAENTMNINDIKDVEVVFGAGVLRMPPRFLEKFRLRNVATLSDGSLLGCMDYGIGCQANLIRIHRKAGNGRGAPQEDDVPQGSAKTGTGQDSLSVPQSLSEQVLGLQYWLQSAENAVQRTVPHEEDELAWMRETDDVLARERDGYADVSPEVAQEEWSKNEEQRSGGVLRTPRKDEKEKAAVRTDGALLRNMENPSVSPSPFTPQRRMQNPEIAGMVEFPLAEFTAAVNDSTGTRNIWRFVPEPDSKSGPDDGRWGYDPVAVAKEIDAAENDRRISLAREAGVISWNDIHITRNPNVAGSSMRPTLYFPKPEGSLRASLYRMIDAAEAEKSHEAKKVPNETPRHLRVSLSG